MGITDLLGGGSPAGGGDSGMSKATSAASIGDRIKNAGIDPQTLLWILGGVGFLVLVGLLLFAFKD